MPSTLPLPNSSGVFEPRLATAHATILDADAPMPGSTPIHTPMADDRKMFQRLSRTSRSVTPRPFISRSSTTFVGRRATSRTICATANRPTMTGRMPKPPVRLMLPKVNRGAPSIGARPTTPTAMPSSAASRPLIALPRDKEMTSNMAITVSTVISYGPNFSATFEMRGASATSASRPRMPPAKFANTPVPSAFSGNPFLDSG